jgi:hypothetical protein
LGTLGGLGLILGIAVLAGVIAYIGDRVGHQVGRKRMTLFGLRPKYTSTIVAVGTGMAIALAATITVLLTSQYARAAFFHLDAINNRVNELQAQADALDKRVHETNVIINRGALLDNRYLVIRPSMSQADKMRALSAFFDSVVASLNRIYVPQGLKEYKSKASDPTTYAKLEAVLADQKVQGFLLRGPVLLLAAADQNLFANDPIHFTFEAYADQLIFHAGHVITSVEVDGGTTVEPRLAYAQLISGVSNIAIGQGMPWPFAQAVFPQITQNEIEETIRRIKTGQGRYYIVAKAESDVYPHSGGIPVVFDLSRTPN